MSQQVRRAWIKLLEARPQLTCAERAFLKLLRALELEAELDTDDDYPGCW